MIISRRLKYPKIIYLVVSGSALVLSLAAVNLIKLQQADALPKCYNAFNAASSGPTNTFPRAGLARNADAGCAVVGGATGLVNATDTNGMHVYLSSYYYNNANSQSALHTPNASFKLYAPAQPAANQALFVEVYWCLGGNPNRAVTFKGPSFIGSNDQIVNFSPAEFVPVGNMWETNVNVLVSLTNPQSQQGICKISVYLLTPGSWVSFSSDGNPQSGATNGVPNRYNQNNWTAGNKQTLGPAGVGAFALRTDINPPSTELEYSINFRPDCTITVPTQVFLKIYDADAPPEPPNPPSTTNASFYDFSAQGRYPRMGVYVYDQFGNPTNGGLPYNITGQPNYLLPVGSDEFAQYSITVQPGYKYAWVFWNISSKNGIQVWMPFSELTASDGFACPPSATPAAGRCSLAFSAASVEAGQAFDMAVTIFDDGGPVSPRLNNGSYPFTVSAPGVSGLSPPYAYSVASSGGSTSFTDFGLSVGSPGTYSFTGTITEASTGTVINTCSGSISAITKPYFKAYGGDVWSGGGFSHVSCTPPSTSGGRIYGFARNTGAGYAGASSQHTVTALLSIGEFFSSSQVLANNPKGLTFANNMAADTYGGNFDTAGGAARCITDFYNDTRNPLVARPGGYSGVGAFGGGGGPTEVDQYNLVGNTLGNGVTNVVVPDGRQIALYVAGDLFIRSNVIFAPSGPGLTPTYNLSPDEYPSLAVVVCGDIYIANNVRRLDGLYVAQPGNVVGGVCTQDPALPLDGGTVYTCAAAAGVPYSAASVYDQCQTPLAFNGSVVAQQIKLLRTRGTLANAAPLQGLTNWSTGQNSGGNDNIAEVFNYPPEMWLARSALRKPGDESTETNDTFTRYDSMLQLPPVY